MERDKLTHFEATMLVIGLPAVIAAYAAMYISGPWIYEITKIDAIEWLLNLLRGYDYPAAFLLVWASGFLSVLVGLTVSHPHLLKTAPATK